MRVVIAEDLFLLRDGLARMLEAHGLEVTGSVDNGPTCWPRWPRPGRTWPWWTCGCHRRSPTRACAGAAARRASLGCRFCVLSQYVEQLYAA